MYCKHPNIIKIKHNRINTTGLIHLTWRAEIYAKNNIQIAFLIINPGISSFSPEL